MLNRFQDYTESVKSLLDEGFTYQLSSLLGYAGLPLDIGSKVLTGGKRIRGALVCMVTATLGGPLEDALPRAIALELIQTATLIHDDFVDQHEQRRDLPALWTLEGSRRAVLIGDIIFAAAIQRMSELGREEGLIVSNAIAEVSRGAYQEPLDSCSLLKTFENNSDSAAFYEKVIYLKTGVLFAAACQLGTLAARTDDRLRQKWRCYGLKVGEAYQIADDLQEVEQCLRTGSITGPDLTSLAPALLFFARDTRPHVLEALRQKSPELGGEFLILLQFTAEAMKAEIERRLRSAVMEIEESLPNNDYGSLALRAPWDILRMFNDARPTASAP